MTTPAAELDFAVRDRRGYWLTPGGWGEHADAKRFDQLLDAWLIAAAFSADLSSYDSPQPLPWSPAENYAAVTEACGPCQATGRVPEWVPRHLERGVTERVCLNCYGYGARAIIQLSTVQLIRNTALGPAPSDGLVHLARDSFNMSLPPLLCGVDFNVTGGPAFSIRGSYTGADWPNTPCSACTSAAKRDFPGLPVIGGVSADELAAIVGAPVRRHFPVTRRWRRTSVNIRCRLSRVRAGYPEALDDLEL